MTTTGAVGIEGLSAAEALARLAAEGPNESPAPRLPPPSRQLAAQMGHFLALMLWVAGVLAFVAGMPQLGGAILVVVVVNGVFAFVHGRWWRPPVYERGWRPSRS